MERKYSVFILSCFLFIAKSNCYYSIALLWNVLCPTLAVSASCLCVLQDRADRAARYTKTREDEKAAKLALLQARQAEEEARKEALVRERR